jgi:hypothetical protein
LGFAGESNVGGAIWVFMGVVKGKERRDANFIVEKCWWNIDYHDKKKLVEYLLS